MRPDRSMQGKRYAMPAWNFTVSGGCSPTLGSTAALTYTMQGNTASGAPYYKADGALNWLYWTPNCVGSGLTCWLLADDAPSTNGCAWQASGLDGASRFLVELPGGQCILGRSSNR